MEEVKNEIIKFKSNRLHRNFYPITNNENLDNKKTKPLRIPDETNRFIDQIATATKEFYTLYKYIKKIFK